MPAAVLDAGRIKNLLLKLSRDPGGDWLLIGGALVALWFDSRRVTEDLDIVGMSDDHAQRYRLLEFALAQGLPVEAVNSAADFFVHRLPGWQDQVEVLLRGSRGTIYRPTATLFLLLKVGRLSEQDLSDCEALIAMAARTGLSIDTTRVLAALEVARGSDDAGVTRRRNVLRRRLEEIGRRPSGRPRQKPAQSRDGSRRVG